MVYVVSFISGERNTLVINRSDLSGFDLYREIGSRQGNTKDIVFHHNGKIIDASTQIDDDAKIIATLRLCGGKGGFGSMLRAIGAQIEKTTNREACRDLSGRRLRDINEEKRLKDYIGKKADREREIQERKRKRLEKMKETPKHTFEDKAYFEQREILEKNLYDSLDKAFSVDGKEIASGSGLKRLSASTATITKKKGRFIDDLDESSSNSDTDGDTSKCSTLNRDNPHCKTGATAEVKPQVE